MSQLAASASHVSPSCLDRMARRGVLGRLADLRHGRIVVHDALGSSDLGQPDNLQAQVWVHWPRFYRRVVLGGALGAAESYIDGDWDCDDLTSLFRIFVRNRPSVGVLNAGWARLSALAARLRHACRANTRAGSRRNIHAHYDLGNEFFQLWLDRTRAYSSGIFPRLEASLEEASLEKFDRICRKLDLRPADHLLEIGTGWGGFAIHAAAHYGCRVTTTTISGEQFALAQERIVTAGLQGRVTLLRKDYRDLQGQFDKLVAIEMIEAVGHAFLDVFFRQCGRLLRPDGSMLIQAITMPDSQYERYLRSVDFIQRFVFPGGCLTSLGAMLASAARTTDLRLGYAEDFAPHYAETLRRWRQSFAARREDARGMGCSEPFLRLWHYYLCYSEAAFEERYLGLMQLQWHKPGCRLDAIPSAIAPLPPRRADGPRSSAESCCHASSAPSEGCDA